MDDLKMFFETDRLLREEIQEELAMPSESLECPKCKRLVPFTADLDKVIVVTCRHCGHKVEVVIEGSSKAA